jgi:hypothetical protein
MCVTMWSAELRGTRLYAGEGEFGGKLVHVLAYQNTALSEGPNAMILPIPAAAALDERNAIDTRKFRDFLEIIHLASEIRDESLRSRPESLGAPPAKVFDVGTYTVVLASGAQAISAALEQVPAEKRPPDNRAVFGAFEENYPGWPLAVCCWNGEIEPEPLLWWYEPRDPDWLFAPALDAHDARPPRMGEEVEVDHFIAFGGSRYTQGKNVRSFDWRDGVPAEAAGLFPRSIHGTRVRGKMPNGDFWVPAAQMSGPAIRRAPGNAVPALEVALDGWIRAPEPRRPFPSVANGRVVS